MHCLPAPDANSQEHIRFVLLRLLLFAVVSSLVIQFSMAISAFPLADEDYATLPEKGSLNDPNYGAQAEPSKPNGNGRHSLARTAVAHGRASSKGGKGRANGNGNAEGQPDW